MFFFFLLFFFSFNDINTNHRVIISEENSILPNSFPKMRMSLQGEDYLCDIPISTETDEEVLEDEFEKDYSDLNNIMEELDKNCYYFSEGGWWIYEVCIGHQSHIKQIHRNRQNPNEDVEYLMGVNLQDWPKTESNKNFSKYLIEDNENPEFSYISLRYENGKVCDMTNKPRKTELRLKCMNVETLKLYNGERENVISGIYEKKTCEYVVDFRSKKLCSAFEKVVKNFVRKNSDINCVKISDNVKDDVTFKFDTIIN